uniref:Uncharacterized protein n=1 Tax=Picea glauca TaxID=3330 RepID=A0A117NFS0_PICGL|nr:hypothetical protein ABT39_MTgene2457 [Picea glauca]QHR88526.1 hypothetical protein Q903MT_gene2540 [Picea sitchensis]
MTLPVKLTVPSAASIWDESCCVTYDTGYDSHGTSSLAIAQWLAGSLQCKLRQLPVDIAFTHLYGGPVAAIIATIIVIDRSSSQPEPMLRLDANRQCCS